MKYNRRVIDGFNGFYQVDNLGEVFSLRIVGRRKNQLGPLRKLKQGAHPFGHKIVSLWKNNKGKSFYVHRLVLEAFIGKCPKGMECRHLDNHPANNKLDNIEWASVSVNQKDRVKFKSSNRGSQCGSSKLTNNKVISIRKKYSSKKWTYQNLADKYNVKVSTISDIIKKRTWRHI